MELISKFIGLKSIQEFKKSNTKTIESYLFFSPDSFSNKIYAKALSAVLICKDFGCLKCPDCIKIIENSHPDVLSFPEKSPLNVEDSKKIIEETTKKPMLADKKIIIINDIDLSSLEAQNKLLKIIEEPPKNVIFIATTTNMDKVLPTIKSRMQKRKIEKFTQDEIDEILKDENSINKTLAIIKGNGYIGKTLEILNNKNYLDLYNKAKDYVFKIKTTSLILENLDDKNINRESLKEIIKNMSSFYSDILLCKANKLSEIENKTEKENIIKVADEFSLQAIVKIQKLLNEEIKRIDLNANASLLLTTMLVKILEVKYLCR